MLEALKASGIDMVRSHDDLDANSGKMSALLERNLAQADSLGLEGTPVQLVGASKASNLDYKDFPRIVSQTRARQADK